MKNYFSFNLTGKKFFPIWILFLIFFIVPYATLLVEMNSIVWMFISVFSQFLILSLYFFLFIVAFIFTFYLAKLTIENVSFKDNSILFNGTFGKYIGIVLLGGFLSIITLGVYMPWFIRNIYRFFAKNSSYDSLPFEFQGKGGKLFVILLLTLVLPMTIINVSMLIIAKTGLATSILLGLPFVMMIFIIPYMYLFYKWIVTIKYKDFSFSWETNFWQSCGKIAVELLLSIITIGIYMPLAMLRLYKYFIDKTIAYNTDKKLRFGYDIDPLKDFLFIWGQTLLTLITLGIYYPWCYTKVTSWILKKTYLLED